MRSPEPSIGNWYRFADGGGLFEVVALDEDDGTIELQHFDGTVEELEFEDWQTRWETGEIEAAAAPEDWTGSVDMDADDGAGEGGNGTDSSAPSSWRSLNG
jgi:hypothetical protein